MSDAVLEEIIVDDTRPQVIWRSPQGYSYVELPKGLLCLGITEVVGASLRTRSGHEFSIMKRGRFYMPRIAG